MGNQSPLPVGQLSSHSGQETLKMIITSMLRHTYTWMGVSERLTAIKP